MEPSEFVRRWESYLERIGMPGKFPLDRLPAPDARLSAASSRFLTEAGLPDGAGLRFHDLADGLKPVYEVFGRPSDWSEPERERLKPYLVLGDDEGGNPVCLDRENGDRIVFLLHEVPIVRGEFVNSSVAQLAECILTYEELVEEFQREYGEDVELYDGNVPPRLVQQTLDRFARIDPQAVVEGGYWPKTLDYI